MSPFPPPAMPDAAPSPRTRVQTAARVVGVALLLIGTLGLVPGALPGAFSVSVWRDVAHLALGVAGLVLSGTAASARAYLIGGGLILVVLFL